MYFMKEIAPRVLSGDIYQLYCYNNEKTPHPKNYATVRNRNVAANRRGSRRHRLVPDWEFGLDARHRRVILYKTRASRKQNRHLV